MGIPELEVGGWTESSSFLEFKGITFEGQDLDVNVKEVCDPERRYQTWPRGTSLPAWGKVSLGRFCLISALETSETVIVVFLEECFVLLLSLKREEEKMLFYLTSRKICKYLTKKRGKYPQFVRCYHQLDILSNYHGGWYHPTVLSDKVIIISILRPVS